MGKTQSHGALRWWKPPPGPYMIMLTLQVLETQVQVDLTMGMGTNACKSQADLQSCPTGIQVYTAIPKQQELH
jgi:hypothetical protein